MANPNNVTVGPGGRPGAPGAALQSSTLPVFPIFNQHSAQAFRGSKEAFLLLTLHAKVRQAASTSNHSGLTDL
jgi:hypothetical protein